MQDERQAACAGYFYPARPDELREELARCFTVAAANVPSDTTTKPPRILVVPHAGYSFSGPVAACAYNRARGLQNALVVLLGPSHHVYIEGVAAADYSRWHTPLGSVQSVAEFHSALRDFSRGQCNTAAHTREHSLEIQLPFLQTVLAPGFSILPLLVGRMGSNELQELSAALAEVTRQEEERGKQVLFVCSTDLSHDYSYAQAKEMDGQLAKIVERLDADAFIQAVQAHQIEACGMYALWLCLRLARDMGREKADILALTNSGEIIGDTRSRIVGYMAAHTM